MTLVATRSLVADAVASGGAVAALNAITLEHAEAIIAGAERAGRAVIVQLSENAVRFHGGAFRPMLAACGELAHAASVSVGVHLDHVESETLADTVITASGELALGSIMVDASSLPYGENVAATARLTRRAHDAGLWVEAELGEVGGKDGAHAPGVRTDPDEAAAFVAATGVDGLAVAVGSSHAMASQDAVLDLELVARLAAAVPVPLVLHGSSGVPDAALTAAVEAGIRKVNVGTALNAAGTPALRDALGAASSSDPRPALAAARDAMASVAEHYVRLL
ncbi:MAG: class II fructose-bisphosphate aldolase [Schumannella sp.]|nr:class II fructose-bisphosphate aldolase [Microbacteriaceae bacterium]